MSCGAGRGGAAGLLRHPPRGGVGGRAGTGRADFQGSGDTGAGSAGACPTPRIAEDRGGRSVTIRNAVYGIQRKLGFGSKQEMVVWAVSNGLLDD